MKRAGAILLLVLALSSACGPAGMVPPMPGATPTATTAPTFTPPAPASPTATAAPVPAAVLFRRLTDFRLNMMDALRGWASVHYLRRERLLITEDGGETWIDRSPVNYGWAGGTDSFLDADTAWAATWDATLRTYGLVHTTDAGRTWTTVSPASSASGYYVFSDQTHGTATMPGRDFYETSDAGVSWNKLPVTPLRLWNEPSFTLCERCGDTLSFYPSGRLIETRADIPLQPHGTVRLWITDDLGRHWRALQLPLPRGAPAGVAAQPHAPIFLDGSHGLMLVSILSGLSGYPYEDIGSALYSTSDGGMTWTAGTFLGLHGEIGLLALSPLDAITDCATDLCLTRDAGQSWTRITPDVDLGMGKSSVRLVRLDFVDTKLGWAAVSRVNSRLYRTTDGGWTWNLLSK